MLRRLLAIVTTIIVAFLLMTSTVSAKSNDSNPDIFAAKQHIITINELFQHGIITSTQAEDGTRYYLAQASKAAGRPLTLKEVMATPDPATPQQLTALQQFAGFITFVNVLWVLAIGIGVISFTFLFGIYVVALLRVLKYVPLIVYEAIFYAAGPVFLVWGWTMGEPTRGYLGLTGCLLFAAALIFTSKIRKKGVDLWKFAAILFVVWTTIAVFYGSALIGFIAIGALLAALGFSVAVMPLCYAIGFKDSAALGKATSAAFTMLTVFIALRLFAVNTPKLVIFEPGALFLGSFVGYLGLLIASSRWYASKRSYVLFQVITIVAGLAALLIGSVLQIPELQRIGGTFFVLYLIEKLMEIPARSARGYAAVGLIVAVVVFSFCMFVFSHQAELQPFLFISL